MARCVQDRPFFRSFLSEISRKEVIGLVNRAASLKLKAGILLPAAPVSFWLVSRAWSAWSSRFSDFMPHGYCYLWDPGLVWLHVVSDLLIAASYFTIPFTLLWFVRKRRDVPFSWMFVLFGTFIVACGGTHVMEVWNLWHAEYWLAGLLKATLRSAAEPPPAAKNNTLPQA